LEVFAMTWKKPFIVALVCLAAYGTAQATPITYTLSATGTGSCFCTFPTTLGNFLLTDVSSNATFQAVAVTQTVPEPSCLGLLGLGTAALGGYIRRKRL
jgi:hypothetical protein